MAILECINDEGAAEHGVAYTHVDPLIQHPEMTVHQGALNEVSSESLVNNSAPEEQERADSPSEAELEMNITDAYNMGENDEAISASSHKLPSAESQGTSALLGLPLQRNSLIPITSESDQTLPDSTRQPHNIGNVLSPALVTDTSDQSGRKVILKDIILEYAVPHSLGDILTLNVMRDDNSDRLLRLTRISNTKWKAAENIEWWVFFKEAFKVALTSEELMQRYFSVPKSGNMMLVASSVERGDEGFLTFTENEIYAMAYVEEDTPVEHVFASAREGYQVHIKMSSTIVSRLARSKRVTYTIELLPRPGLKILEALDSIKKFKRHFDETGNIKDIDQIIFLWEEVMRLVTSMPGFKDQHSILNVLGSAYFDRFNLTGNVDDVDCAISHHHKAVDSAPSGHPDLLTYLTSLGIAYYARFECTGDLADMDCAISHHQQAVDSTPSGHTDLPGTLSNLGNSYLARFKCTGDLTNINCAISHHQQAVDSTPSGHYSLPSLLNNLGNSYMQRSKHTGDLADMDCAIYHHQQAVDSTPSGHTDLPGTLSSLGNSCLARFRCTGDLTNIDCAISSHQQAVNSTPSGHYTLPNRLNNLGNSYLARFECTGDLTNIDSAISHHQKAVDSTPSGHYSLPGLLNNLGSSYLARFECTGDLANMNCAISHYQQAVDSTPSGHTDLPGTLSNLGNSYLTRFTCTGDLTNIDCAISSHQQAVNSTPSGHYILRNCLNNLGNSYLARFDCTGDLANIDSAISHHQKAVDSTPSGHANLPTYLHSLGNSYLARFYCTGDLTNIDYAISHYQQAVDSTPSGHTYLPGTLNNLGNSYLARFKCTGDLADMDYAISHYQQAVDSTPSGHTTLPGTLSNLGNSYLARFDCTGDLTNIDCAISHHQQAVDSTPSGHTDLPGTLSNLGNSYLALVKCTWDLTNIDCAISYHQQAVDSTPSGHTNLPTCLNNLGNSYSARFERTGDLADIECAIHYHQQAVDSTPSGHANLPTHLSCLGNSYMQRSEHTGDLADIDSAISHHQQAVGSTPSGHVNLPTHLSRLGSSYLERFERTRDLADIDSAISHHQQAVGSTPSGYANLPTYLDSLGSSYLRRFGRTGDLTNIDSAISHHQKAVDSTPLGHADLPGRLNNLGSSYLERFERTGDLADMDCAISHHQQAVDSTPSGHTNLPTHLSNLGNSYLTQFECTGDLADMDCAISHHQQAVDSTPSGHTNLPSLLNNLGNSYMRRFLCNNHEIDVQHAITLYRRGAQSNGPSSDRLKSAQLAALYSVLHGIPQCLLDFALAIGMLSEVAGLEQTIHRRYDNLFDHSDFVATAVSVAIARSRPDLALEWLEQGRCLVWNQLNQLRTPIDSLRNIYPSLAHQFISVASALESYGSRSVTPKRTSGLDLTDEIRLQNDAQKHTLHANQYTKLLDQIRALPEFEDFLRPPKVTNILSALPTDGPVVVFNFHELRCDALALISGIEDPLCIPLDNFSLDKAKQLLKTLRFDILKNRGVDDQDHRLPRRVNSSPTSMSYVLKELWLNVVQPVLEALGYSFDLSGHRRIWWCPSGPLAFLPIHAAGIYGSEYKPGTCISDYAVSSYTPTVQSLNAKFAASSASPLPPNILIINPNTPGLRPIPETATESHGIKELFGESALLLEDAEATIDTVKQELRKHNWVHFACHGIQDLQDPLKSGVNLFDGRLELLDIMRQKLSNADFAFLSACQTSKGDTKISEEVVHIAAGMLAAGYRGVVATMWSISDRYGPQFAMHFYDYLFKEKVSEGLDSTKATYALDYATRKVRETLGEGDDAFLIWVPYVHFGY